MLLVNIVKEYLINMMTDSADIRLKKSTEK